MIKALITDVSRVLLFPKDKSYSGGLNALHKEKSSEPDYKFLDYFELNIELLEYYKSLKDKLDLYIFTSETIQDAPELQPDLKLVFKHIFSASKMDISKKENSAYKKLIKEVGLNSEEIIYIDDSQENINAAKQTGLQTILYIDNKQAVSEIMELIEKWKQY